MKNLKILTASLTALASIAFANPASAIIKTSDCKYRINRHAYRKNGVKIPYYIIASDKNCDGKPESGEIYNPVFKEPIAIWTDKNNNGKVELDELKMDKYLEKAVKEKLKKE